MMSTSQSQLLLAGTNNDDKRITEPQEGLMTSVGDTVKNVTEAGVCQ